jgi:hypothetical protein
MRGWTLAVVLLAACGQSGDSKDKPPPATAAGAAAGTATAAATASADAAPAPDEKAFTDTAEGVAKKSERHLGGQGVAQLGEDERAMRYAILEPDDLDGGRGAYLIEEAAGKLWLVSHYADGRTMAGLAEGGRALDHAQGHHHGGETVRFAFRDGVPVVLYHEYVDDAEEGEPEIKEYAKDGVCAPPCPPLRGYQTHDADFQVVGPAATADELLAKPE